MKNIRNSPYGVYRKTETHHMVFFDISTINNKLTMTRSVPTVRNITYLNSALNFTPESIVL